MSNLPQLTAADIYLADGGLETTLVFLDGLDLPDFAAFPLLDSGQGKAAIDRYYASYLDLAEQTGAGFVLDTPPGVRTGTGASDSDTTTTHSSR